jgi:hypothetical protein
MFTNEEVEEMATDNDRKMAEALELPLRTIVIARQPLPRGLICSSQEDNDG